MAKNRELHQFARSRPIIPALEILFAVEKL
jgi:hypothetical protein